MFIYNLLRLTMEVEEENAQFWIVIDELKNIKLTATISDVKEKV